MAKLVAPKKPTAKAAPKKPSSRSKTGNSECSAAASNWQLAIRGKASLSPDTYQTLAKCRALSSTKKRADAYGRTGKLSDMGAAALSARADKRFSQGLVTQKSRTDRLNMLLKQRSERGKLSSADNRREARAAQTGMTPEQRSKEAKRISATLNNRREAGSGMHSVATGMGFKSVSDKSVFDEAIRAQRANRQTRILTQKGKSGNLAAHSTETRDSLTKMTNSEFDRLPSDMQKRASQNNSSRTPYVNTTVYTRAVEIELEKTGKIPHGFLDTPIGGITHRERINRRLHMGMTPEDAAGDLKPFLEAAGKKGTSIPAKITSQMILQQQSTTTPPKPAEPARYSLGGKLAPGRGTEERAKAAGILKNLRSRNNDGRTIARSIRDNAVHEWGRWGTGKSSVGNDPAFRAKRILNQSEQMRSSYESSYADSVIAADKLVTKTGKLSVPGIRQDKFASFYSTIMTPEMAVKQRLGSLRESASVALNHVRIMKQAGIPETNYIAKPKPTKDYRKNPLTRLKAAVKAAK